MNVNFRHLGFKGLLPGVNVPAFIEFNKHLTTWPSLRQDGQVCSIKEQQENGKLYWNQKYKLIFKHGILARHFLYTATKKNLFEYHPRFKAITTYFVNMVAKTLLVGTAESDVFICAHFCAWHTRKIKKFNKEHYAHLHARSIFVLYT